MQIYVDAAANDYNQGGVELLEKAGYKVCPVTEFKPVRVADPDAWKSLTTMEAVYKFHGLDDGYMPDLSSYPAFMRAYKAKEFTAQLMAAAINGSWVADWTDTSQRKYYPWWKVSGRGLSLLGVYYDVTNAYVGPRLCFESDEKVRHAVKYFTPVFEDHYFTV